MKTTQRILNAVTLTMELYQNISYITRKTMPYPDFEYQVFTEDHINPMANCCSKRWPGSVRRATWWCRLAGKCWCSGGFVSQAGPMTLHWLGAGARLGLSSTLVSTQSKVKTQTKTWLTCTEPSTVWTSGQKRFTEHNPFTFIVKCQGEDHSGRVSVPRLTLHSINGSIYGKMANHSRELDPMFEPSSPAATWIAIDEALLKRQIPEGDCCNRMSDVTKIYPPQHTPTHVAWQENWDMGFIILQLRLPHPTKTYLNVLF